MGTPAHWFLVSDPRSFSRRGTPVSDPRGTPLDRTRTEVPSSPPPQTRPGQRYPLPSSPGRHYMLWAGYAVDGTPLAVTQEDFLVFNNLLDCFLLFRGKTDNQFTTNSQSSKFPRTDFFLFII